MVIDARNKLKPEHITQFLENADNDIISTRNDMSETHSTTKYKLVDVFLAFCNLQDTVELTFSSGNTQLLITGMDINWWKDNARRYNKLYKAAEEALGKEPPKTYRLGIATLIEGQLSQINLIEGTKDVVLKSLNENIRHRYIDSFLKAQIVINLAYEVGDENDVEQWYTLDELRDMKAIKMEG